MTACKLAQTTEHLRVAPIPSQGDFPCEVAKKYHSANNGSLHGAASILSTFCEIFYWATEEPLK